MVTAETMLYRDELNSIELFVYIIQREVKLSLSIIIIPLPWLINSEGQTFMQLTS